MYFVSNFCYYFAPSLYEKYIIPIQRRKGHPTSSDKLRVNTTKFIICFNAIYTHIHNGFISLWSNTHIGNKINDINPSIYVYNPSKQRVSPTSFLNEIGNKLTIINFGSCTFVPKTLYIYSTFVFFLCI